MTASPKFSRKTYRLVVEVLRRPVVSEFIIRSFAARFLQDNPRFKYDKFIKACGLPRKDE